MGWPLVPFPSPLGGGRGHAVTGLGLGVALVEVHGHFPHQLALAAEHRGMYTILNTCKTHIYTPVCGFINTCKEQTHYNSVNELVTCVESGA